MGKLGDMLSAGGKGMLDGMAQMGGLPGNNLNGKGMIGGPMSGINIMNALFDQLGIFKKKSKEADPHTSVGPPDY